MSYTARMAKARSKSRGKGRTRRMRGRRSGPVRRLWRWAGRLAAMVSVVAILTVVAHRVVPPPPGLYMGQEARRLGGIKRDWVPLSQVAPVMARAVVAAEDADFCLHWGFDMNAIRAAIAEGARRGASTLTQQTVKNVYLWHGRSWPRKALEALLTPAAELLWPKRRILEVYLNVAEFDTGVFGIKAAAEHHFGIPPDRLNASQASRLAAVLPDPKGRSAVAPSTWVTQRAAAIREGAATIAQDGRADCFQ